MSSEKTSFICQIDCPFCGENIHILKKIRVLKEAIKAEKEEQYVAEKGTQTKLFEKEGSQQ